VRRVRSWITAIVAAGAIAAPLSAQRVVTSLDLSGTNVWYADTIRSGGAALSPALRLDWAHATVSAFANVSRLGNGGSSTDGMLAPSVFSPSIGPFVGELGGSLGGSGHQDGTRTGQVLALGRAHLMTRAWGAYVGADVGRTWDGAVWHNVRQGEAGVWLDYGGRTWLATVTPVAVEDSIRYTDFQAALRYPIGVVDFGASVGARAGSVGAAIGGSSRVWGNASAVVWVGPRLALVASAGAYPVDLTQGYPGGRFVTVALRIGSRDARSPTQSAPAGEAGADAPSTGTTKLDVRTVIGRQRIVRVYAPAAQTVELNGDFTQWQAVSLTRGNDGWWTAECSIAAGTHQMNIRINGGEWLAPPGLVTSRDEFGGIVGILTVE
jgi:Carbohydrate-binding module 48 (Isoamylase N-terminal domain)